MFSGTSFVRAPELQYTISADYSVLLQELGELSFSLNYSWSDKNYHTVQNIEEHTREAGGMLNADMRWDIETDNASLLCALIWDKT